MGQLVGERYQVERRLGAGGMGEVYLARHVLMGRPCALKVMTQELSQDPDAVSRFNREASSASKISHPNVCTVYDFGLTADDLVYLAMEYIEGRTLSEILDASGPLPLARAAALIAQCAAGLFAAHELGIVHRDLKPDNIMVLSGKEGEVAKLVDFGIAKAVAGDSSQRLTRTGFMVGTPEYMSPEQLSGDPVGIRSDQYSLALVFYRMLTGRLPFEGTSLQETLVKRLTTPPRPLAISRPGRYPAGLQAVMDRALAREPDSRYASVVDFSAAVSGAVTGDLAPTRKLAAPGVRRPTRRTRLAAGVLGALLLGSATWGALRLTRSTPPVDSLRANPLATHPAPPPTPAPLGPRSPEPTVPSAPPQSLAASPAARLAADTAELSLNALETPALRVLELQRARRLLGMPRLAPARRARAAAFLGTAALEAGKADTARMLFRMAWRLDPKPLYRQQLLLVGDTIPR
ncbi:MAG TPA: serine/threonine-protein kinase [Gemmatimonadales bacterium]|nr:serine/threonine-protein kinase [Gemmatimonadales bacterium]